MRFSHVPSGSTVGAHVIRTGEDVTIISSRGKTGRYAAYRMLTRGERAGLAVVLGSAVALLSWLDEEAITAATVPVTLRLVGWDYSGEEVVPPFDRRTLVDRRTVARLTDRRSAPRTVTPPPLSS